MSTSTPEGYTVRCARCRQEITFPFKPKRPKCCERCADWRRPPTRAKIPLVGDSARADDAARLLEGGGA